MTHGFCRKSLKNNVWTFVIFLINDCGLSENSSYVGEYNLTYLTEKERKEHSHKRDMREEGEKEKGIYIIVYKWILEL